MPLDREMIKVKVNLIKIDLLLTTLKFGIPPLFKKERNMVRIKKNHDSKKLHFQHLT